MNTTFEILWFSAFRILENSSTCVIISSVLRFLVKPILPVAQKSQFIEQPIWQDTQMVLWFSEWRIRTVSTCLLSSNVIRAFCVFLSLEIKICEFISSGQSFFSVSLRSFGREFA